VIPKQESKFRFCADFWDLTRASPKDNFPLPNIDMLVDNAARCSNIPLWTGFRATIKKMAQEDKEKTTFVTPWGTLYYKVMSFGLKNIGAT